MSADLDARERALRAELAILEAAHCGVEAERVRRRLDLLRDERTAYRR